MADNDVIRRMCGAYISTLNSQPEDCRDGGLAMLAAVRDVLWDEIIESGIDGNWGAAHWLRDHVIKPVTPPDQWPNVPSRSHALKEAGKDA